MQFTQKCSVLSYALFITHMGLHCCVRTDAHPVLLLWFTCFALANKSNFLVSRFIFFCIIFSKVNILKTMFRCFVGQLRFSCFTVVPYFASAHITVFGDKDRQCQLGGAWGRCESVLGGLPFRACHFVFDFIG